MSWSGWGQVTETFSTPGTYTWVCPVGVTAVTVQAWGGGGAGGGISSLTPAVNRGGGGGGGGSYATSTLTVIPGTSYSIVVGAGGLGSSGNGNSGGNTTFNTTSIVAIGGSGGFGHTASSSTVMTGGLGASSSLCVPSVGAYSGGNGGNSTTGGNSGAGGGSAGSGGTGGNASGITAGTAGAGLLVGVVGALGLTSGNNAGTAGSSPGSGGSGARAGNTSTKSGGSGGAGKIIITYNTPTNYQSFDASTLPTCWSTSIVAIQTASKLSYVTSGSNPTTASYHGTNLIQYNSYSNTNGGSGSEERLISPIYTSGSSASVSFAWRNENSTSYNSGAYLNEGVQLQYSTNGTTWTNAGSFIPRYDGSLASGNAQWNPKFISLPAGALNQTTLYIAFKFHSEYGNNCFMDFICFEGLSTPQTVSPIVSSPIACAATTISGTSTEANGTVIEVFNGATSLGTTTVSSGAWTKSGLTALAGGATITAKATANCKTVSAASSAVTVSACTNPLITVSTTSLTAFNSCAGVSSSSSTFTVSASNLGSNDLTVTPPTGFEISSDGGVNYVNSSTTPAFLTFTPSSGTVSSQTITVRMMALSSAPTSSTISCAATGATTKTVSVSGTVINNLTSSTFTYSNSNIVACTSAAITSSTVSLSPSTNNGTLTYSISPALPTGLTFSSTTGAIGGTPTATQVATTHTITVSNGCSSTTATVNVTVYTALSALNYTTLTASYCVGAAITSNAVTGITGGGTITYSVNPSLPSGLSLNTSTGEVTGNPSTSAASAPYTVTASNGACTTTKALTIVVNNNLSSSTLAYTTQSIAKCVNSAITTNSATLSPSTNNGTVTYSVSPTLPTGLSLSTSSGALTGTPSVAQSSSAYTISATSACGGSTSSIVNITINALPTIAVNSGTYCSGGTAIALTASGASTYAWSPSTGLSGTTGSSVNANPTSTTTYTVTGTDANTCVASATSTVTYVVTPSAVSISQTPSAVCSGDVATLAASGGVVNILSIGSGASTTSLSGTSSTNYVSPFSHYYGGYKAQYLIKASELTSAGIVAGNLNSLAFDITTAGTTYTGFTLSLGQTSSIALGTTFLSPTLTQVYTGNLSVSSTGALTLSFGTGSGSSSTFSWDGTSNIVINLCWSNNNTGGSAAEVKYDGTAFVALAYFRIDSNTPSAVCSASTATSTQSFRPKITFGQASLSTYTWSPTTNLYTNSSATTAYAGASATTVYALNTSTTQYTVTATNGACTSSNSINTSINTLPTITLGTASAVCAGGTSSDLIYSASTGSPNQYVIDYDATANTAGFSDITTYTSLSASPISLVIPAGASAGTYNGTLTVKNSSTGCMSTTNSFSVVSNAPVTIASSPANQVVLPNDNATFSVSASGTGLTYQWEENTGSGWNTISNAGIYSGAITNTLTLTGVTTESGYQYRCVVSGTSPCAAATSTGATLTISTTAISAQPTNQSICNSSGSATFSVTTTGTTPSSIQWQVSTDGGSTWADLSGATNTTLSLTGLTTSESGYKYHCVINGNITSNAATLTVSVPSVAGSVSANQGICAATTPTSITLSGSTGSIQWQVSTDNSTFSDISSATSSTLASSTIGALNSTRYYSATVTSGGCSAATSGVVTVTVTPTPNAGTLSGTQVVCANSTSSFTSNGDAGGAWTSANTAVATVNISTGVVSGVAAGVTTITYTITGTGGCTTTTATRTVTVNAVPSGVSVSSSTICNGGVATIAYSPSSTITAQVGNGSTNSAAATTPYRQGINTTQSRVQYLVTQAELNAVGIVGPTMITSLGFNVVTAGAGAMPSFTISLAQSSLTTLTSTYVSTGFTTVYSATNLSPVAGINTHNFQTYFSWDGNSNIVVNICHTGSNGTTAAVSVSTLANVSTASGAAPGQCSVATAVATDAKRPNIYFGTNNSSTITWTPTTPSNTLYTDANAATAYTSGASATTVYALPTTTTTYTATATSAVGCTNTATATITVNQPSVAPTGISGTTSICIGASTTLTATGGTLGTGANYEWGTGSVVGTNPIAGQTSASITVTPTTTTTYWVRIVNATSPCTATTAGVSTAVTVDPLNTWIGGNGNWSDPNNWCGGVPTSSTAVVIANNATVTLDGAGSGNLFEVASMTINSGATLVVATGEQLTLTGALVNNGAMIIETGATFKQGTSVTGNGTYNVQQYLTGSNTGGVLDGRFWYMGVPLNVTRTSSFGDETTLNRAWTWSETGQQYGIVQNGTTLTPTTGIVYRRGTNGTISFSGTGLYAQDATLTGLTKTGAFYSGYHLLANPYTAYLDFEMMNGVSNNMSSTIWTRAAIGSSASMVFDTYNATSNQGANPSGGTSNQYIAPMQAFWVRVAGNTGTTGNISMTRAMTSHDGTGGLKSGVEYPAFARVNVVDGPRYDQTLVYLRDDQNNAVDAFDSEKMFASGLAQVYTMAVGKKLVMNGLKNNKKRISVPLYFDLPSSKVYELTLAEFNMENGIILLEDKQEGIIQDFTINDHYAFYASSGTLNNRFVLHFYMPEVFDPYQAPSNNWANPEPVEGGIFIGSDGRGKVLVELELPSETQTDHVQILNAAGQVVFEADLNGAQTEFDLEAATGIYLVKVTNGTTTEIKKIIIQH